LPARHRPGFVTPVIRALLLPLLLLCTAAPAAAEPQSLGAFGNWAAFRESGRCYAIAAPSQAPQGTQPFASVGVWQGRGSQLHIRLSRDKREGSAVLLRIDGRTFQLLGSARDAWAPDPGADAEIQAAMRTGVDMLVETRATGGSLVRDQYGLRGAATAMDAAAIACAPRR
jgi:hypothetical protein